MILFDIDQQPDDDIVEIEAEQENQLSEADSWYKERFE